MFPLTLLSGHETHASRYMSQYGVSGLALARSARHRVLRRGYHIGSLGDAVLDSRIPEGLRVCALVAYAFSGQSSLSTSAQSCRITSGERKRMAVNNQTRNTSLPDTIKNLDTLDYMRKSFNSNTRYELEILLLKNILQKFKQDNLT